MSEQPKITIVLLNYQRPQNIPIILNAIKAQTVKATTINFTVFKGEEEIKSINLVVEDRVSIKFTVVAKISSLDFYIIDQVFQLVALVRPQLNNSTTHPNSTPVICTQTFPWSSEMSMSSFGALSSVALPLL